MLKRLNSGFIKILTILLGLAVFVGYGWYFLGNKSENGELKSPSVINLGEVLNPAPDPFAELTIPYLREREYKSSLGELDQISKSTNYTSYLTSYDSDGNKVNGLLTIPEGTAPEGGWPGIVFVHGYIAPEIYETLEKYQDYVDYLARNGFVVFKIDLRGHGDSEGEPGGGYYSSDYVIDTLNARAALAASDFVNPNKIGLWGHSMAGNVVSRALAASPEIPAISIWAGAGYTYSDISEYGIDDNSYRPPSTASRNRKRREELGKAHGAFDADDEFWKQVPFTNYLKEIKAAIQLNHAVDDNIVGIDYSRNLAGILEKTDIPFELNEYASGGHNLSGAVFGQAMGNTVEFFKEYLK